MIVKGGSRRNVAFFARHLTRTDHNARVAVIEIRGLAAQTVRDALREMQAIANGTRTQNFLYHANLNPRDDEQLTAEQWHQAADILERHLGLTDQPRIVVEHHKEGRTHRHVIWSRIDADSMKAISDALTYRKHEQAAREIEQQLGHPPVPSVLVKNRTTPRPPRRPSDRESFRGAESGRSPQAITAEITALWHSTDRGQTFAAAMEQRGYILTRGDRRDFCVIDPAGDDHSLARRIAGVKAADIRARMADLDRDALPSVAEGRAIARRGNAGGGASDAREAPMPLPVANASARHLSHRPTDPTKRPNHSAAWYQPKPNSEGRLPPRAALPPRDAAEAVAQVRAVTAQYTQRRTFSHPIRSTGAHRVRAPRFAPATSAAMAAAQVQAVALPFIRAIEALGQVPEIVAELVSAGVGWLERATHYLAELAEDMRSTVTAALTWQDRVRPEREAGDRHDALAFDRGAP